MVQVPGVELPITLGINVLALFVSSRAFHSSATNTTFVVYKKCEKIYTKVVKWILVCPQLKLHLTTQKKSTVNKSYATLHPG
jgi:hypothetical protein